MSEAEHAVVAAILQKPSRISEVPALSPRFFESDLPRALFSFAASYHAKRDGKNALDLALARDLLSRSSSEKARALADLVEEYADLAPVTDAEFREALLALVTARRKELIRSHGVSAIGAILEGDWERAKSVMRAGVAAAEDAGVEDDAPADLRSRAEIERGKVEFSRPVLEQDRFDLGFRRLSKRVSFRRQELTILAGYTADGKTQIGKTFAWNVVPVIRSAYTTSPSVSSITRTTGSVMPETRSVGRWALAARP